MPRQYGRMPPGGRKQPDAPQPVEIQVNLTRRHTMEQLALEVQRALAMVEDYGAAGVEAFRFRLLPLDDKAKPLILRDEQGRQVTKISIPAEPEQPPYRANEPGVGVKLGELQPQADSAHRPSR